MVGGLCIATLVSVTLLSLLMQPGAGLLSVERQVSKESSPQENKAILEMLHIDKLSASASHHQAVPHPYMRRIYGLLEGPEAQDWKDHDGMLVQSFRSVSGGVGGAPGWIWFNLTGVDPSAFPGGAELVLFRKTLHASPLSVGVTLHVLTHAASPTPPPAGHAQEEGGAASDERRLRLDRRPASGYDVFSARGLIGPPPNQRAGPRQGAWPRPGAGPGEVLVGFQLRYTDEGGSLELHEALTRSLYSLGQGSPRDPLLVLYHMHPREMDTRRPPFPSSTPTPPPKITESSSGR